MKGSYLFNSQKCLDFILLNTAFPPLTHLHIFCTPPTDVCVGDTQFILHVHYLFFQWRVPETLHWDWYPDHSGYSGASLPANGPDPAAATGTLLSLVSSWRGQLARVPRPVRNKTLLISLSFPLCLLSLTLPILPCFSSPPVLDAGIWLKCLSLSWGLETDHLLLAENLNSGFGLVWFLVGPSSSPPFSGGPG